MQTHENVSGGVYEVTKQLPHNGREFEYRIKSVNEPHERVARESAGTWRRILKCSGGNWVPPAPPPRVRGDHSCWSGGRSLLWMARGLRGDLGFVFGASST